VDRTVRRKTTLAQCFSRSNPPPPSEIKDGRQCTVHETMRHTYLKSFTLRGQNPAPKVNGQTIWYSCAFKAIAAEAKSSSSRKSQHGVRCSSRRCTEVWRGSNKDGKGTWRPNAVHEASRFGWDWARTRRPVNSGGASK
jgi:hypothetical protein